MSGYTRPATDADMARLWPAVKAAHLMASLEQFSAFRDARAVAGAGERGGDALVVARWREHLDLLAIRGLWSAPHRLAELVEDARAVARAQGFAEVLSPLASAAARDAYLALGMHEVARIVALQANLERSDAGRVPPGVRIRLGASGDLPALADLDARCFGEFWRYGLAELADSLATERLALAEDADSSVVLGYATCELYGSTATLGRLAVAPDARRRGVGTALLSDAMSWARRQGAFALTLVHSGRERALEGPLRRRGLLRAAGAILPGSVPRRNRARPATSVRMNGLWIHL